MKKEEITLKNTKAEILDALNLALEREKKLSEMKYEPQKEEEKKKEKKAIEETKVNVEQKIFSEEFNNKFKNLEVAINAEEEKLKTLYGIEDELNNLTVVINAGKDYMNDLEISKKTRAEEIENEIKELEEKYRLKKEELENEYELRTKNLKLERDREIEEYNYKTKREREIANNKWEDEKLQRELELAKKEEEVQKLLEEATEDAKNTEILKSKVNEIPDLLEKEYAKAKKEVTAELEKVYKYETELLKKDFQNNIDRQKDKIESLQEEVNKLIASKDGLQEKLDKAYIQIKEIANKTVEAAGGVKILANSSDNK